MFAAEAGKADAVAALLAHSAKVDARDHVKGTALMCAIVNSVSYNPACVRLLLGRGAAIEAKDDSGSSALLHAASYGQSACIRQLLQYGANIAVTDVNGMTALQIARRMRHPHTVKALAAAGAKKQREIVGPIEVMDDFKLRRSAARAWLHGTFRSR